MRATILVAAFMAMAALIGVTNDGAAPRNGKWLPPVRLLTIDVREKGSLTTSLTVERAGQATRGLLAPDGAMVRT